MVGILTADGRPTEAVWPAESKKKKQRIKAKLKRAARTDEEKWAAKERRYSYHYLRRVEDGGKYIEITAFLCRTAAAVVVTIATPNEF